MSSASVARDRSMNTGFQALYGQAEERALKAKPFFKCPGGKRRQLREIFSVLPRTYHDYWEPFCGAAALFFALEKRGDFISMPKGGPLANNFRKARLNDANVDMMFAYEFLKCEPDLLFAHLRRHQKKYDQHGESYYYRVRAEPSKGMLRAAARFLFINRTCFNGVWRVNKSGELNVPHGKFKTHPIICDTDRLQEAHRALQKATLTCLDFGQLHPKPGDLVYYDPPYWPRNETADFTHYTPGGFSLEDQQRLASMARGLRDRGVHVVLSNADLPPVRRLYRGWRFKRIEARRSINSDTSERGPVGELLIW